MENNEALFNEKFYTFISRENKKVQFCYVGWPADAAGKQQLYAVVAVWLQCTAQGWRRLSLRRCDDFRIEAGKRLWWEPGRRWRHKILINFVLN